MEGARTADGYAVELLLPWSNLGFHPEEGKETALQVMVNDSDAVRPSSRDWFRVAWHPDGHTGFKRHALHRLRLTRQASPPVKLQRAAGAGKGGLVKSSPACTIPPVVIPRLNGIAIDGETGDWKGQGFRQESLPAQDGTMRSPENFDPSFRLGWDDRGLLLAAQVRDQALITDPETKRLWRKDSVEIFMTRQVGTKESFQLTIAPETGPEAKRPRVYLTDQRGKLKSAGALAVEAVGKVAEDGYALEILLPWRNLGIDPGEGKKFGLQVFFNDADDPGPYPADWFRAAWYPLGHAGWNPLAFHRVRLAGNPTTPVRFLRGPRVNDSLVRAAEPYPWPLPGALKGKSGEDRQWKGPWQGAVRADKQAFVCELAIPWKTLSGAGVDVENMIVDFSHRGRIVERPSWSFVPVDLREAASRPEQPYTVRLHFAELTRSRPGDRIFDVKLQGKPILPSFDPVREAGGRHRALVKEFRQVMAGNRLILECTPRVQTQTWTTAPVLNGLEVIPED